MKSNQQTPLHSLQGEKPESATPEEKPSVAEIRQRIRDGAYDSDAVLDSIARRILDHGDLAKFAGGCRQLVPGPPSPSPEEPMSFSDEADERTLSQF